MNVLIVDTDKVNVSIANEIYRQCVEKSNYEDWVVIPKDFSIMTDVSIDWMKMIRNKMDEKIKEIEGDINAKSVNR